MEEQPYHAIEIFQVHLLFDGIAKINSVIDISIEEKS
jgi:hypothetical protein